MVSDFITKLVFYSARDTIKFVFLYCNSISNQIYYLSVMLRLNCFFQAKDKSHFEKALAAAVALTEKSLTHEGNIAYDVFASGTRPDVFMICETWADQASLDKHSATEEFKQYVGIINECGTLKLEQFEFNK
jgi:quinol monooxygenase YgiN